LEVLAVSIVAAAQVNYESTDLSQAKVDLYQNDNQQRERVVEKSEGKTKKNPVNRETEEE